MWRWGLFGDPATLSRTHLFLKVLVAIFSLQILWLKINMKALWSFLRRAAKHRDTDDESRQSVLGF